MSRSVLSGNVRPGIMKRLLLLFLIKVELKLIASLVATLTKNYVINKDISQTLR